MQSLLIKHKTVIGVIYSEFVNTDETRILFFVKWGPLVVNTYIYLKNFFKSTHHDSSLFIQTQTIKLSIKRELMELCKQCECLSGVYIQFSIV